jgi:hypothetical protein
MLVHARRQAPQGDYSHAPKNIRNYVEGKNILPQGIITSNEQNIQNVEHIIKYLHSDAFDRKIQDIVDARIKAALANLSSVSEKKDEDENESGETEG